jgi:hypothetical protein
MHLIITSINMYIYIEQWVNLRVNAILHTQGISILVFGTSDVILAFQKWLVYSSPF